jgi:anthranilate synthase/aminodeoxychorismate synthase-like glutamine amidotransferase
MPKILLLDNFDSFTYNLVDYLLQLGATVEVKQNTTSAQELNPKNYDGILLSPGPETPAKAGNLLEVLAKFAGKIPMLGVCLGHQAIGEYFGAELAKGQKPMHGKVSVIEHTGRGVFANLPSPMSIVRYHSLVLKNLPPQLIPTAYTINERELMGFRHMALPIEGVQFHPEAILTEHGLAILKNWLSFIQQENNR